MSHDIIADQLKPASVKKRDIKEEEKKIEETKPPTSLATNLEQEYSVIQPEENVEIDEDF